MLACRGILESFCRSGAEIWTLEDPSGGESHMRKGWQLPVVASLSGESASAGAQADEQREIVGHDRRPHVGVEVVETTPRAAGQAVGPLQAGDAGLDPGAE